MFKANVNDAYAPVLYLGTMLMNKYYTVFDQSDDGTELFVGFAPRSKAEGAGTKHYDIDAGFFY